MIFDYSLSSSLRERYPGIERVAPQTLMHTVHRLFESGEPYLDIAVLREPHVPVMVANEAALDDRIELDRLRIFHADIYEIAAVVRDYGSRQLDRLTEQELFNTAAARHVRATGFLPQTRRRDGIPDELRFSPDWQEAPLVSPDSIAEMCAITVEPAGEPESPVTKRLRSLDFDSFLRESQKLIDEAKKERS